MDYAPNMRQLRGSNEGNGIGFLLFGGHCIDEEVDGHEHDCTACQLEVQVFLKCNNGRHGEVW